MINRLELQAKLKDYVDNVYFQPPSNIKMTYPCIVYHKRPKRKSYGNNAIYKVMQQYQLTVIEEDPDSNTADRLEEDFEYCTITQHFTMDNLNHTTLTLFY